MSVVADKNLLLDVHDLKVQFDIPSKSLWPWAAPHKLKAVDGVSIRLYEGETLGVVGESGCGKSTFAKVLLGLETSTSGELTHDGQEVGKIGVQKRTQAAIQSMETGDTVAGLVKLYSPERNAL